VELQNGVRPSGILVVGDGVRIGAICQRRRDIISVVIPFRIDARARRSSGSQATGSLALGKNSRSPSIL